MPGRNISLDRDLLAASLRDAGNIARTYFKGTYKSWNKASGSPVTEADIAIDDFLKEHLLAARPDYGWLSEESIDDTARLSRDYVFVIDPIDGTHGFLKGRPHFTIAAAVVHAGRPVAGAIYNPITEHMFAAAEGMGATCNGDPIRVSARPGFENAKLLAERRLIEAPGWPAPWPSSLEVETRASVAYRMALVAAAEFDAMMSLSAKSDWDVAAGDLIVREAGGLVTTGRGEIPLYNRETPEQSSIVCAGPALHAQLLERLNAFKP